MNDFIGMRRCRAVIEICSTSTLFILLSDLFDTISLDACEQVFSFVERRVALWKLVRTCGDDAVDSFLALVDGTGRLVPVTGLCVITVMLET